MKILTRIRGFLQTSYDFFDGLIWAIIRTYSPTYGFIIPKKIQKDLITIARASDTSITQVLREMLRQFLRLYRLEFEGAQIKIHDAQGEQTLVLFPTHRKFVDTTKLDINVTVFFGRAFLPDQLRRTLKEVAQSVNVGENVLWQMALKTGLVIWETQRIGGGVFHQENGQPSVAVRLFAR